MYMAGWGMESSKEKINPPLKMTAREKPDLSVVPFIEATLRASRPSRHNQEELGPRTFSGPSFSSSDVNKGCLKRFEAFFQADDGLLRKMHRVKLEII